VKVVLTGGGTGGHLYPGLAIIEELEKQTRVDLLFIGTRSGIEARVIPEKGITLKTVWISGLQRGRVLINLLFPLKMAVSFLQSFWILYRYKPEIVIGTGGYVTWPVISAAIFLKIKNVLHEQNRYPGLVIRKLAKRAGRVFLSFESSRQFFSKQTAMTVTGNPTRAELKKGDHLVAMNFFQLQADLPVLFIFGGSQGARDMNRALLPVVNKLTVETDIQIIWAAGKLWYDEIKAGVISEKVKVYSYIKQMDLAYAVSDLLICRAGATTLAEITSLGLPAILIPFPGAADNHQEKNAVILRDKGACLMIPQNQIETDGLVRKISKILMDKDTLNNMAQKSKESGKPAAAADIAAKIQKYCLIGEDNLC